MNERYEIKLVSTHNPQLGRREYGPIDVGDRTLIHATVTSAVCTCNHNSVHLHVNVAWDGRERLAIFVPTIPGQRNTHGFTPHAHLASHIHMLISQRKDKEGGS